MEKTPSLASVDLSVLNSLSKQMVFYTNVLNLLYAHALMFYFSAFESDSEKTGEWEGVVFPLSSGDLAYSVMQTSRIIQAALFDRVGYHLGQLGIVSCLDLHHSILCRGLTPTTLIKDGGLQSRLTLTRPDPWLAYAPNSPDPRLFYVIHDGHMICSAPTPLTVENIESTLTSAEGHYLNANVRIDIGKRTVTLPSPLADKRSDFGKMGTAHGVARDPQSSGSTYSHVHQADMALFRYLQERLDSSMADILLTMMEAWEASKSKRVHLAVRQTSIRLGYMFGARGSGATLSMTSSSPRGSPKGRRKRLSRESSRKDLLHLSPDHISSSPSSSATKRYSFTPEMFEFVKKQKPLLAGLVALVCPPISSTSKAGISIEEEIQGEGGRDTPTSPLSKDRDKEESSKSFMKSLRSKVVSPVQAPPSFSHTASSLLPVSPTRSLSLPRIPGISDDRDSAQNFTPWQRHYNEVLAHFQLASPMKRFLEARLSPFEEIVLWWGELAVSKTASPSSELNELDLCTLAAAPPSSEDLENACMLVMKNLVESGHVAEAVQFLTSEPAVGCRRIHVLAHMALSCHFVANYQESLSLGGRRRSTLEGGSNSRRTSRDRNGLVLTNPVPILSQLSHPESAARLTLASLHNWPVDVCVEMLDYCIHHLPSNSNLTTPLSGRLERMRVYARIMSTCDNPLSSQLHGEGRQRARQGRKAPWKTWADLAKDSEAKTNYVLRILLEAKEFELSRKWCHVHELSSSITRQIEVDYLFDLLEGENPNPIVAHQVS